MAILKGSIKRSNYPKGKLKLPQDPGGIRTKKRNLQRQKDNKLKVSHNKKLYKEIVVKSFGSVAPSFDIWEGYIEAIERFKSVYFKYLGPMPTTKTLNQIDKKTDSLILDLMKKDTQGHYDNLIEELVLSGATTRNLIARRKNTKKKSTILSEENKAICRELNNLWKHYKKKKITGTYNWRLDHALDREYLDEYDPKKNPGAFLVQATLREYFGVKLDCKQTKDLIMGMDK